MTDRRFIWVVSLVTVLGLLSVGIPRAASAGVFSFVKDLLFGEQKAAAVIYNSQNIELLKAALSSDPNTSKGGGDITIVGGTALLSETGPAGTIADIENEPPSADQISIYVVREGDTLSQIASMFGVSTNTIVWANDIKYGSHISPGQVLVILPISGVQHVVKDGDTLASIAKKYKGDEKEIRQYNELPPDAVLAVGDIVTIPDGEIAAPKYTTPLRSAGGPSYAGYYLRPIQGGSKSQGLHGYNAVDLATYYGAPILASAAGDVIIVRNFGWNGGYGNYVVIRHPNGTQTLYAHNSQNIVGVGQHVVQGQVIGYVGSTGRSTGSHVHFEIRGARNPF